MAYNIDSAVAHTEVNALSLAQYLEKVKRGEQTYCARAVRLALEAGGVTLDPTRHAWQYGDSLIKAGFVVVEPTPETFEKGDVVVIEKFSGSASGHMAIYNGKNWVSDFVQTGIYPGAAYRSKKPRYKIYRFPTEAK